MQFLELLITFLTGFSTSFFGTITGGMALINVPMLIFLGLSSQAAVATNKLSSLGFTAGFYKFKKEGKVNIRLGLSLASLAIIGSYIGANLLLKVQEDILKKMIGIITILILLLIVFKRDIGIKKIKVKITPIKKLFGYLITFFLGIYNGFFGGGSVHYTVIF